MDTIPGLLTEPAALFDERTRPDFRDVFGALAVQATDIAVAVTRVRLSTVDLTARELASVEHFRVLVAEMNALRLDAEARAVQADPRRAPNAEMLRRLLEAGTLEVRSSPLAGWSPDFSVFAGTGGPTAVLVGFHSFERPYPHRGPALAALHGPAAARLASHRHAEIWDRAHDVGPAIWSILSKARSGGRSTPSVVPTRARAAGR
ncbi:MAG: hypothetical protein AB7T31_08855 [Gemmatimonadales bacterium]